MLSRREVLLLGAQATASLALTGCATSQPLKKDVFPDFGDASRPYLGLATTLSAEHSYEARVEGSIPAGVRGTLYRNGPGLFDRGGYRKRNLLDGDGLVQSFTFHESGVHYRNRFVRTRKFVEEEKAGHFIYPSWSTQAPGGMWANFMRSRFQGQAGITVFPWRGQLYAFDECALPYQLDPGTLQTAGISTLGLPDGFTIYAAHAKFDPVSGEWLHFGVLYGPNPQLHITVFKPDGALKMHRSLRMPRSVYLHDWFVAERHFILSLHPVQIDFWAVFFGRKSMVEALSWHPEKGNLVMVLEREGEAAPVLLETEACYMWHSVNAYQRGGEIVADFIGYGNPDHFVGADPVASAVMQGRKGEYSSPGEVRRYLINPASRSIRAEVVAPGNYEWPRVNELHRCHSYRYGYQLETRPGDFFWTKVCRIDMLSGGIDRYDFGAGVYVTEPVFVPVPGRAYHPAEAGEPGWLLAEVYDSHSRLSYLAILRAERVQDGPIATVRLTHHVPFSYHGWWSASA
ncbi:carotenoid oxygenase family protein [Geomonas sp.]|uniref:carotenoid oxygenase family protein n=1 Tax=Geomonas sp. TaxID=2651584 RepID=UPI002B46161D|nr:carotenoid oxygenase family protein [Geomonas sp.]HJV36544.1 carotenoid oxygenase family protein [Geomonas sp.]